MPAFKVFDTALYPLQALKVVFHFRGWSIKEVGGMVEFSTQEFRFVVSRPRAITIVKEWYAEWEMHYLPRWPVAGKTILDIGAGFGETAAFYFSHRALKVICVEPSEACSILSRNAVTNGWNCEVLNEHFALDHLRYGFDFMKMDCEGCESLLLDYGRVDFPCAIEVHNRRVLDGLVEKTPDFEMLEKRPNRFVIGRGLTMGTGDTRARVSR